MTNTSEAKKIHELQDQSQPEAREAARLRIVAAQRAQDARDIGERTAEAAARTADAATDATRDMTQRAADQNRRMVEATARVTDVYRDGAARTKDDVQALVGTYLSLGRGFGQYQRTYLDLVSRSMKSRARKWQDLFQAHSPVEFAQIQCDIYLDGVNNLFTGSTTLLQLAGQIAEEAVQPLQKRALAHAHG